MKYTLISLFLAVTFSLSAQRQFQFQEYLHPDVTDGSTLLENGFAAGLNNPQFSEIDLNNDGQMDLLVFDRDGSALLPYLTTGTGSARNYKYAPEYVDSFPDLNFIVKTADFNCDGKMDLFAKVPNGIGVWENTSTGNSLSFTWALGNDPLLRTTFNNGQTSQVYVLELDMPVIQDVDGDGDIDILSFETNGVQVYFYENVSANNCGLDYNLSQECWGGFQEDSNNNGVVLDACIPGSAPPMNGPEDVQHAGSTVLSLDMNNDGLQELVMGDISFPESTLLTNTGTADSAYMSSQTNDWAPDGNVMVDLYVFPAFYYLDLDFDGVKDLVAAPNIMPSKTLNQVWFYKNNGTNTNPSFNFVDSSFLQSTMIDLGEGAFPTFVDLNGDGQEDIVVGNRGRWLSGGNYFPSMWYLRNTSTGSNISFTIANKNLISFAGIADPLSPIPTFADMDSDGDFDMIVGFEDGTLAYYQNNGTLLSPNFVLQTPNFGGIDVGQNAAPELYDFDGDGDFDLIIGEKDGTINYYENTGSNNYSFVTNKFGGINMDFRGQFKGYSVPRMYDYNNKDLLMVGSEDIGVQQFDSAAAIINQPSVNNSQFGTGSGSTSTSEETPFGAVKRTGRNQILFTAAELQAAGFVYGQVESIGFKVTTTNTSNSLTNGMIIRMGNIDSTELNSFQSDLVEVYDYVAPITPGWNDFNLQEPFIWDGESSLVIEICFSRNLPLVDNHVEVTDVGFNANAYGDITGWNSNVKNGCNMPYLATSTLRPNTRMQLRPITAPAGNLLTGFRRMNADFSDLDFDSFPEAIIGTYGGGLILMKGEYRSNDVSTFEVEEPLNVDIYPNPTDGRIRVVLEDNNDASYQVIDLNGRLQFSGEMNGETEIDLSTLANGMYILRVIQEDKAKHAKIIKH